MSSVDPGLIPLYTTQFSTTLELLLQQNGSKLRPHVSEGFHVGKMASPVNQVGALVMKPPAGRFAPKNRSDAEYIRRWVFPTPGELEQLVDTFDELQTVVDPKSALVQTAANATGRAWDDVIIAAAPAASTIGQDAGSLTSEAFDTTKFQVAVNFSASAATGLSVAKMIETKRILRKYHNDLEAEAACMIIGSQQEADLLSQVQIVSTEYNDRPVLVDGSVRRFLGFNIVVSERLPYNVGATNQRGVLAFVKSGVHLGIWKEMENVIARRNDLSSNPWSLTTNTMYGATRTQLGKVLQVLCADSTGADITP